MAVSIRIDIKGMKEIKKVLDAVKFEVQNKVIKAAIGKAARKSAKIAKRYSPRGPSGTLSKSIGTRFKSYRRGESWVFAIGPRSGFVGSAPHQPKRRSQRFIPTFYGHLAEKGRGPLVAKNFPKMLFYPRPTATFRIAQARVAKARGFKFMARAYKFLESSGAKNLIAQEILAGILRESARRARNVPDSMMYAAGSVYDR